ncbi:MAG: protein kinase [Gammaproteobacteria bacterium]|nr:protein kinase [Gammaproteobacteria bacterium]
MSILPADQINFVHLQMSQHHYHFKLAKHGCIADPRIDLTASVLIDHENHAYAVYPNAVAGMGKSKVKFVQDVDSFEWYVVKKFTYKPTNEIEMLKMNNRFVSYLEIEPKANQSNMTSTIYNMLYHLGFINGKYYVIQKLIDGESLLELSYNIMYSNLSEKVQSALGIVSSIEKVHRKNIIHRDIKGGNLMYDQKKQKWNLVDFGESLDRKNLPFNGKMTDCPGTEGFDAPETSPEFYNRHGYTLPSYKSDIYSLGIVFRKYIFCDEDELVNSSEGKIILSLLTSMTHITAALRPSLEDIKNKFQCILDKTNHVKNTLAQAYSVDQASSKLNYFTIFNQYPKTLQKTHEIRCSDPQFTHT